MTYSVLKVPLNPNQPTNQPAVELVCEGTRPARSVFTPSRRRTTEERWESFLSTTSPAPRRLRTSPSGFATLTR